MRTLVYVDEQTANHYVIRETNRGLRLWSVNAYGGPTHTQKRRDVKGGFVCDGEVIDWRWRVNEYSSDDIETVANALSALRPVGCNDVKIGPYADVVFSATGERLT